MAIAPLNLPGYAAPQSMDFSSLGNLGQVYKTAAADTNRQQTLARLGQGENIDPRVLLASGDMSLANLGLQIQGQQTSGAKDSRDFAFRQEEAKRAQQNADRSFSLQSRAAARADQGPVETAGQRAQAAEKFGIPQGTPEFKAYVLTGKMPEGNTTIQNQTDQRRAAAQANGLTPDNPAYNSYVLTGKMPREDAQPLTATDKKAVLEADEMVQNTQNVITNLSKAKELSKAAFAGPMADKRGYAASFLGESSDIGKAGIATTDLNNLVSANALSQLKTIFGGNPTEGERKILLDIQGSAGQPDAVRQKIYDRAIEAANRRMAFSKQRADELRGGQFYKPQGSMTRAPVAQSQGISQQQYEALPSGSPFTAPDGTQRIKP